MERIWVARSAVVSALVLGVAVVVGGQLIPPADPSAYGGSPECGIPPQGDCPTTRQYSVGRLYSTKDGKRHVALDLEIAGDPAANYCPPAVCTPDLVETSHSALYKDLHPGSLVKGVTWRGHVVQLQGEDGQVMNTAPTLSAPPR